jgi:hypothetical protein
MSQLEDELQYYISNQEELVSKYEGKYLVIKDKKVVGVFESEIQAYDDSKDKYELGTFLIQPCMPGQDNYTQTFHSRAVF